MMGSTRHKNYMIRKRKAEVQREKEGVGKSKKREKKKVTNEKRNKQIRKNTEQKILVAQNRW